MTNTNLKDYKKAKAIIIIDDSEYKEGKSSNGGCYLFRTIFYKERKNELWTSIEETSGEFCPYCRSFDCPGSCEEAEMEESREYTKRDILRILHRAKANNREIILKF